MRLFIGLELPKHIKEELMLSLEALKKIARGNFTLGGNLHITLQFLGERSMDDISTIQSAMHAAAAGLPKLSFRLSEPGRFSREDESIFWYGIEGDTAPLGRLSVVLARCLAEKGIVLEKNAFKPHITLGRRITTGIGIEEAFQRIKAKPVEFSATEMVLFESKRLSSVLAYIPVCREVFTLAE